LKALYGLTYLFITHDFAVVRFMADRVLVLKDGQVIEQGQARQIIDRPQHEYTRSLVAAVPA
jgi:peptide/nickel transport system ATP-binding protein